MGTKLLLADDSITIQKVVGIIFANEDYDLTVVDNGILALDKAREILPDAMLVDALMPGRNGYEVCQEVRADATLKHIPLLLMTGAFEPFDENKARECGADDFISKPFESQQLVEKVKALLETGKQRFAAAPPVVAVDEPAIQTDDQFFASSLAGPWDEPAQEMETPFEPIPEMFDLNLADTESVQFETSSVAFEEPSSLAVEIVEAAPGDDPWGVFDLVDLEEAAAPPESVASAEEEIEEPQTIDPYGADAFVEDSSENVAPFEPATEKGFEAQWQPLEEEVFNYQHDEPTPPGETFAIGMGEPLALLVNEPEQYTDQVGFEPLAAQEEPLPVAGTPEIPVAQVAAQQAPLGEEQLRAILSQISRETIEKIVWEIVPDLAENLIREEIRKIKQGFGS